MVAPKHSGGWRGNRGTRHERGYGAAWVRTRRRILDRDLHLCQPCLRRGVAAEATEVDHVKPKSKGGTDALENLSAICKNCHAEKTAKEAAEAQGRTLKKRLKFDSQGFPIWED